MLGCVATYVLKSVKRGGTEAETCLLRRRRVWQLRVGRRRQMGVCIVSRGHLKRMRERHDSSPHSGLERPALGCGNYLSVRVGTKPKFTHATLII